MKLDVLRGLASGINFFKSVENLGKFLLLAYFMMTSVFFWLFVSAFYAPLSNISVLFLKYFQISFICFIGGFLFRQFLIFWYEHEFRKKLNEIDIKYDRTTTTKPAKKRRTR